MPESVRDYVVSEGQVRIAFLLSIIGGVLLLVVLLFLMSSQPDGDYRAVDETQFQQTVARAAEELSGYDRDGETGAITIPVERAMQLVVEQGVNNIQFGEAQPQQPGQQAQAGGETQPAPEGGADWQALGETTYGNCAACHQANGQGVPGAFPPLAGHMPPWQQLSDEQVAAVLNHELTSWGNAEALPEFQPILPEDVAAQRDQGLSAQDVYEQRQTLGLE